jgi:hypothetical protein
MLVEVQYLISKSSSSSPPVRSTTLDFDEGTLNGDSAF